MSALRTERELIELLNLDAHAINHPAPKLGERSNITILENRDYSREAIAEAVRVLDTARLHELLSYTDPIFNHNNMEGSNSYGGFFTIDGLLRLLLTPEEYENIHQKAS